MSNNNLHKTCDCQMKSYNTLIAGSAYTLGVWCHFTCDLYSKNTNTNIVSSIPLLSNTNKFSKHKTCLRAYCTSGFFKSLVTYQQVH